jgi:hypothetical protein
VRRDSRGHRSDRPMAYDQAWVSVFDGLGPIEWNDAEQCFNQEVDKELRKGIGSMQHLQWHPWGIFTRSQNWRVQRLHNREMRAEQHRDDAENCNLKLVSEKQWSI